eukprot:TRINITY_DN6904_c0_g2_i3.p1 TRINITY_DN6904_c0_g2~~TRINITY_DN6904_c0_g2_i3.p1  ORF type:complete len:258 (-),score=37.37 TRINITY_DN6904_c0_g2_i3:183-956(-)
MRLLAGSFLLALLVFYQDLPRASAAKTDIKGLWRIENEIYNNLTRLNNDDLENAYKVDLKDIGETSDPTLKNLKRNALVSRLLYDVNRNTVLGKLISNYNTQIPPIEDHTFELQFSQDGANANFSNSQNRWRNKWVQQVGTAQNFNTNDFLIAFFVHPDHNNVLVADNNRGLAAHVIAGQNVGRFRIILEKNADNVRAFQRRRGDGLTLKFDKNIKELIQKGYFREIQNTDTWVNRNSRNQANNPGRIQIKITRNIN